MKLLFIVLAAVSLGGCQGFRYAATEAQKENAWLHQQVCAVTAEMSIDEDASGALCGLTSLAHDQSQAFVADYGIPENPQALLEGAARVDFGQIAAQAKADSMQKPDVFEVVDGVIELGIAVAGLIGGVYGIRIASYLKQAREKSRAIKEIVAGNELFKQLWPEQADRFKEAQHKQSSKTKKIVAELKAG